MTISARSCSLSISSSCKSTLASDFRRPSTWNILELQSAQVPDLLLRLGPVLEIGCSEFRPMLTLQRLPISAKCFSTLNTLPLKCWPAGSCFRGPRRCIRATFRKVPGETQMMRRLPELCLRGVADAPGMLLRCAQQMMSFQSHVNTCQYAMQAWPRGLNRSKMPVNRLWQGFWRA